MCESREEEDRENEREKEIRQRERTETQLSEVFERRESEKNKAEWKKQQIGHSESSAGSNTFRKKQQERKEDIEIEREHKERKVVAR